MHLTKGAANVFVFSKSAFIKCITLVLFVVLIMALILGHSQVKYMYMHEYLVSDKIVTLCYPGYQICDFLDMKVVCEMVPSFSVSTCFVVVVVLRFNVPPTARIIRRRGLGLNFHPKGWR